MVLLIVRRRPSLNFCFKSLLLLQFLFDNSEFFTGETRHIVPPCNKAQNFKFLLRIPEIAEIPDFLKTLLLLQFLFDNSEFFTGETRHIVPPCNKAGISNFCLEFQKLQKFQWKRHFSSVLIRSFWNFTGETSYIVWPYNKARISKLILGSIGL